MNVQQTYRTYYRRKCFDEHENLGKSSFYFPSATKASFCTLSRHVYAIISGYACELTIVVLRARKLESSKARELGSSAVGKPESQQGRSRIELVHRLPNRVTKLRRPRTSRRGKDFSTQVRRGSRNTSPEVFLIPPCTSDRVRKCSAAAFVWGGGGREYVS
jgi:hypothetical protein